MPHSHNAQFTHTELPSENAHPAPFPMLPPDPIRDNTVQLCRCLGEKWQCNGDGHGNHSRNGNGNGELWIRCWSSTHTLWMWRTAARSHLGQRSVSALLPLLCIQSLNHFHTKGCPNNIFLLWLPLISVPSPQPSWGHQFFPQEVLGQTAWGKRMTNELSHCTRIRWVSH